MEDTLGKGGGNVRGTLLVMMAGEKGDEHGRKKLYGGLL